MQDTDVFVIKLVMFASVFAHNKCVKGVLFVCEFLVLKHFVWFTLKKALHVSK